MKQAALKIVQKELIISHLYDLSDLEVCEILCNLNGVGVWTAEMLMIFSLNRKNILSYGDLGIRRGLCMLYHHKTLTKTQFERYRKRYSPYGTIASLYLWAISSGEYLQD
jgi:DNA-3-methyladenine glycosylase II